MTAYCTEGTASALPERRARFGGAAEAAPYVQRARAWKAAPCEQRMTMATSRTDVEQKELWNGAAGRGWVDTQDLTDGIYRPFEELLAQAAADSGRRQVLDIGCGTGVTTLAIARRLGPSARCTGIDISAPMIGAARARAEHDGTPADFVCDNAQTHTFAPAAFDLLVSRFGVMFFDDPVRAFANLRSAATSDAALRLIAWRSAADNPFMTAAERAAAPLLPHLPARRPGEPGQFAFADAATVRAILDESGWGPIEISPLDVECAFPEPELERYLTRLGPVGRALESEGEPTRQRVIATVRAAFDPFVHGDEVRFTAACWMIAAR
jgi:SAM-dependent methyltransferase